MFNKYKHFAQTKQNIIHTVSICDDLDLCDFFFLCDFTFLMRLVLIGAGSGGGPFLGRPVVELTSTTGVYLGTENDLDLKPSSNIKQL